MKTQDSYTIQLGGHRDPEQLSKGCWMVILHAGRIPPHIGLVFNGKYCSLNLKARETDIDIAVLLRKIGIGQIRTIFVKLQPHPIFSVNFLHEHFKLELENYEQVTMKGTCFAPVRSFMQENYLLKFDELDYLYKLFPALYREKMIAHAFALHLGDKTTFEFVPYLASDIEAKLKQILTLTSVKENA